MIGEILVKFTPETINSQWFQINKSFIIQLLGKLTKNDTSQMRCIIFNYSPFSKASVRVVKSHTSAGP